MAAAAQGRRIIGRLLLPCLASIWLSGCGTAHLHGARRQFYAGRLDRAEAALERADYSGRDAVLLHMERGLIRQARADYEGSIKDFLAAADLLEELETYSVTEGVATWTVSEQARTFKGLPYEQALLHAFAAKSFMGLGRWDEAAVEARRLLLAADETRRGAYPDNAYARYIAGLALELIGDYTNAALQYRLASQLLADQPFAVDENSGRIVPRAKDAETAGVPPPGNTHSDPKDGIELICFVLVGQAPKADGYNVWYARTPPGHAEIRINGRLVGRSYPLADTATLATESLRRQAAPRTAKLVARILWKNRVSDRVGEESPLLGELLRWGLLISETPDERRWETLPRSLQVARVRIPADTEHMEVRLSRPGGPSLAGTMLATHHAGIALAMYRDLAIPMRLE